MIRFFTILILLLFFFGAKAQESVLHSGNWYKVAVDHDGVYKINFDALKKMGFSPDRIDPRNIKIYGNPGEMLPQSNDATRPADLIENAIVVAGEEDGKFNKKDFVLFYAQGADAWIFDADQQMYSYEKNLYSDENYYFITVAETPGKRLKVKDNLVGSFPVVNSFTDKVHHESDLHNELTSGREWVGENFGINENQTFTFAMGGVLPATTISLTSDVMAQSYIGSSFNLFFNGAAVGEQKISSIINSQYETKGKHKVNVFSFLSDDVSATAQEKQSLNYQYKKSSGYSNAYLDYFTLQCSRRLALYNDQTIFSSPESLQNAQSHFQISTPKNEATIWDITNPAEPSLQTVEKATDEVSFSDNTNELHTFIIFNENIPAPKLIGKISNQNLHSLSTPNLVIVVYPDYKDQALRLANHRQTHSGWTTVVVTTDEVYNEFSSGRADVSAIRDFTRFLYLKNPGALRSLLLFGRGSYDYKNRLYYNTNFVPTYESRNSLDPLSTYSSDDYFGFLEDGEGEWSEDPSDDYTLDIGVGRFPVKNLDEAQSVVDKIIDYETNPKLFGSWRKDIVFVADDGDFNTHQTQSDKLAQKVESLHPEFNARRIFLDSYPQVVKPSGEFSQETNNAIQDAVDRGTLIINYTGHGGEKIWAQEKIFDNIMIDAFDNKVYPLFVTATCEFGRSDDPGDISSAELAVTKKNGGAIGMVTTARPVSSNTNFELNQAFYDALFTKESNSFLTLGEIFKRTKNNSVSGVSNRNFSLLGDPSMKLAFPEQKIAVTEILNNEGTDTLKALSTITVHGEIRDDTNAKLDNFKGTIQATLFDKMTSFTTLGNENPPYTFKQWDNKIFRGSGTVSNGSFEFNFIVPKNIAYQVGQGKLSLYASSTSQIDASGVQQDFAVGASNKSPIADSTPPEIKAYMGDESFIDGSEVDNDTYLIATLHDGSGINISGYGIGNSIVAMLDDGDTPAIILNDYYIASQDDFTQGRIAYRMKNLSPGKHTLTIQAWDTFNNPAEASVHFTVSENEHLHIESAGSYPNPSFGQTTLFFTHNRPGDDLDGVFSIYDITGQLIKSFTFNVYDSNFRVELPELDTQRDFNKKLSPGLYLVKLLVRSLTNDSKNEQVTRLIILN